MVQKVITNVYRIVVLILLGCLIFTLIQWQRTVKDADNTYMIDYMEDSGTFQPAEQQDVDLLKYRKIVISCDINNSSSRRVIRDLLYLDARDHSAPIDLYILTGGGWIDNAFGIIDVIETIQAPVNTHALGCTHSAGAMILAAGTGTRYGYTYSSIMFHAGLYDDDGRNGSSRLDNNRLIAFWREHANLPEKWITMKDDEPFFISSNQAQMYRAIDQIVPPGKMCAAKQIPFTDSEPNKTGRQKQ